MKHNSVEQHCDSLPIGANRRHTFDCGAAPVIVIVNVVVWFGGSGVDNVISWGEMFKLDGKVGTTKIWFTGTGVRFCTETVTV